MQQHTQPGPYEVGLRIAKTGKQRHRECIDVDAVRIGTEVAVEKLSQCLEGALFAQEAQRHGHKTLQSFKENAVDRGWQTCAERVAQEFGRGTVEGAGPVFDRQPVVFENMGKVTFEVQAEILSLVDTDIDFRSAILVQSAAVSFREGLSCLCIEDETFILANEHAERP